MFNRPVQVQERTPNVTVTHTHTLIRFLMGSGDAVTHIKTRTQKRPPWLCPRSLSPWRVRLHQGRTSGEGRHQLLRLRPFGGAGSASPPFIFNSETHQRGIIYKRAPAKHQLWRKYRRWRHIAFQQYGEGLPSSTTVRRILSSHARTICCLRNGYSTLSMIQDD